MVLLPLLLFLLPPLSAASETWQITHFSTRYMAEHSGTDDGAWPAGSAFNTTVAFTITRTVGAERTEIQCGGAFLPFSHDTLWRYCDGGTYAWRLEPGHFEAVPKWGLNLYRAEVRDSVVRSTYAQFHIVDNEPENPQSFLTCTEGAPLEGWSCDLDGPLSVPSPIEFPLHERKYEASPFAAMDFQADAKTGYISFVVHDPNAFNTRGLEPGPVRYVTICRLRVFPGMLARRSEVFTPCDDASFSFKLNPSADRRGLRLELRRRVPLAMWRVDGIAPAESVVTGPVDLEFDSGFNLYCGWPGRDCSLNLKGWKADAVLTSLVVTGSYGLL